MREDYGKDEIQLRGMYLQIACDYEWMLTDIIFFCSKQPLKDKDAFLAANFEKVTMGKKLEKARTALKSYNSGYYYTKYSGHLKIVEKLTTLRNKYAHSVMKSNPEVNDGEIGFLYMKNSNVIREKKKLAELYNEIDVHIDNFRELSVLWSILKGEASAF